jgi:hypothetical protein
MAYCEILFVLIFIVVNIIGLSLTVWGIVYVSAPPSPWQACNLIGISCNTSPAFITSNIGYTQLAKMQYVYVNNTQTVNANYPVYVDNTCLNTGTLPRGTCASCTVGINYLPTAGSTYYCDINNDNGTIINNWYFYPCGSNIVYVAPLVIGLFILVTLWIIYICMCCECINWDKIRDKYGYYYCCRDDCFRNY